MTDGGFAWLVHSKFAIVALKVKKMACDWGEKDLLFY